jgi:hypothetical protein|tara:strand:+ start:166 stop:588 length:423 start_codon:yes stop_codon:yes gene_type:complete
MTNKWEVLLERDNGYNRTVIIEDCMYENEARDVAESMYGMNVLRVLYKGPMNNEQPRDYNDFERHAERTRYKGPTAFEWAFNSSGGSGLGLLAILPIGIGVILIAEYWLPIALLSIIGSVTYGITKYVYPSKDKKNESTL